METTKVRKKQNTEGYMSINEKKLMNEKKNRLISLDAYSRHKLLVNEYLLNHVGSTSKLKRNTESDRTDFDVLRDNHQFVWNDNEPDTWEKRLAKKYYDALFKEYCVADLTFYEQNKIALRWRTEKEVLDGKGQFMCGDKNCVVDENLKSWEVNFAYREEGTKKNALVKLRLCEQCSVKLNFREKRKELKRKVKNQSPKHDTEKESQQLSGKTSKSLDKSQSASGRKRPVSEEKNSSSESYTDMDFVSELLL